MTSAAVELTDFSKTFGPLRALAGVTASIPRGAVGLLGPNGAGKSTLVKCLLGLVKPTSGSGKVLGIDLAGRPLDLRQRVGYLPEVDCHIPGMSAVEFVAYAGELVGMHPREAMTRAHEVIDYVGLADERYRLVHTYSTGMRQRVKLAQALVHDPELLFLDEPTNGLDPKGREMMLGLVQDLTRCGMSVIYSSHLLADVEQVCETVLILRQGKLLAQGKVKELLEGTDGLYELEVRGTPKTFASELVKQGLSCKPLGRGRYQVHLEVAEAKSEAESESVAAALEADSAEPGSLQPTETSSAEPVDEASIQPSRLQPTPPKTESPSPSPSLSKRVFLAATTAGVHLRSMRPLRTSLEDVFIDALEGAGSKVE